MKIWVDDIRPAHDGYVQYISVGDTIRIIKKNGWRKIR